MINEVSKNGRFSDLINQIGHVLMYGIPWRPHACCIFMDVVWSWAAPFSPQLIKKVEEGAVCRADEERLEGPLDLGIEGILCGSNEGLVGVLENFPLFFLFLPLNGNYIILCDRSRGEKWQYFGGLARAHYGFVCELLVDRLR